MSTPVLALAITAVASAPIISISALPPSNGDSSSTDTSARSYPLSAAAPFNLLLLAPIFACISLGLGVLAGMLLHRRCLRRKCDKRENGTTGTRSGAVYPTGLSLPRGGEDSSFVVGTSNDSAYSTPTSEKPETATLLAGHKSANTQLSIYEQHHDDDAWDANDVKTPLLSSSAHAFSHPSLHAVSSPAIDTHNAALWLAATAKELVVSRPSSMRPRSSTISSMRSGPLFDDTMDVPEPPFDYEVSLLYESQEGIAR
ncbi:hypothetical protein PENSPDRAFT_654421 [Peniophora sp. CONT]|nr:hypothetical protein PENSPDRAFT_654421 [Peniophora sp. CONT]